MTKKIWNVLVTGGAGYVGSALIPKLLDAGHSVTVLDLYLYGDDVFAAYVKKNAVNFQRQESGYTQKDHGDSKHI